MKPTASKKTFAAGLALACALACTIPLSACGENETYTRMTVDINPSVEFILDGTDKVVSVTALNDDGAIIIAGEAFVGKSAEDAARLVVSIATETGYLVKGESEISENRITITLSGDEEAAQKLYEDVCGSINSFLESERVQAVVARAEAATLAALRSMVSTCRPELTEQELAAMTERELINELRLSRTETALLLTESLRELYYDIKAYEIDVAERETTVALIDGADVAYQALKSSYSAMLEEYEKVIRAIEDARYETLVSSESSYQKALRSLLDAKAALLEQQNKVAQLADGPEKTAAQAILTLRRSAYDSAYSACKIYGDSANAAIDLAVASMQTVREKLNALEADFPEEIKSVLTGSAEDFDNAVNEAKENAFARFENKYGDDIRAVVDAMTARKEALIAANG